MTTLHSPSRLSVAFDDDHAVANAGLALVGLLSEKLGLQQVAEETINIAPFPGRRVPEMAAAGSSSATTFVSWPSWPPASAHSGRSRSSFW